MKRIFTLFSALFGVVMIVKAQSKFLSDISTETDVRTNEGYIVLNVNYWRYDTCLYSKQMCKFNTSAGVNVKVNNTKEKVVCELLMGNNSGYQSKNPYDTFVYTFFPQNLNASKFVRRILIKEKYARNDSFNLTPIDTFLFTNQALIKKVFGELEAKGQKSLRVYVLQSNDELGRLVLHYWVERIGIVKVTNEKCWQYSFEMKDNRTKSITRIFSEIMKLIKAKYKDPYWVGEPCSIEK
jgi:hypothetical protein